jgi:hypothetical protein
MKPSNVTWCALALLLSLAFCASSSPDTKPDQATVAVDDTAATQHFASSDKHAYGHYKHESDEGYDHDEEEDETYPSAKKHKGHDKPEYYRGDSHLHGDYGYPHKPKHHGYYPKPPKPEVSSSSTMPVLHCV